MTYHIIAKRNQKWAIVDQSEDEVVALLQARTYASATVESGTLASAANTVDRLNRYETILE